MGVTQLDQYYAVGHAGQWVSPLDKLVVGWCLIYFSYKFKEDKKYGQNRQKQF